MSSEQGTLRKIRVNMLFDTSKEAERSFVEAYDSWLDGTRTEFVKMILIDAVGQHIPEKELDEKIGAMFRRLSGLGVKHRRDRGVTRTKKQAPVKPVSVAPVSVAEINAPQATADEEQKKLSGISNPSTAAALDEFAGLAGGNKW